VGPGSVERSREIDGGGSRQDDAKGPMTKCELTPLEPDELMNQEFNSDDWYVTTDQHLADA